MLSILRSFETGTPQKTRAGEDEKVWQGRVRQGAVVYCTQLEGIVRYSLVGYGAGEYGQVRYGQVHYL